MLPPHGGRLVNRVASAEEREACLARLAEAPRVPLDAVAASDLDLLAIGAYSPLTGFLDRADYESVLDEMRLADGLPWSLPIVLPVDAATAEAVGRHERVALVGEDAEVVGALEVTGCYPRQKEREARQVYGTTDAAHPGVEMLQASGEMLLAGPVTLLTRNRWPALAAATRAGHVVAVSAYGRASVADQPLMAGDGLKALLSLDIDADRATCLILVCRENTEARWGAQLTEAVLHPDRIGGY